MMIWKFAISIDDVRFKTLNVIIIIIIFLADSVLKEAQNFMNIVLECKSSTIKSHSVVILALCKDINSQFE